MVGYRAAVLTVGLLLCSYLGAAETEFTLTLDPGSDYRSASDDAGRNPLKAGVDGGKKKSIARKIRFGDLGEWIRGDKIEILDAKLRLYYRDEYWSTRTYHVTVSRSLDGSVTRLADEPECVVKVKGDRLPNGVKTPLKSWLEFPIKPATVQLWIQDEKKNQGLVIHVPRMDKCDGEKWWFTDPNAPGATEDLTLADLNSDSKDVLLGVTFGSCGGPPSESPKLVVRYRVTGNTPPSSPKVSAIPAGAKVYGDIGFELAPSVDVNGDAFNYEVESAFGAKAGELKWRKANAAVEGQKLTWRFASDWKTLAGEAADGGKGGLWLRVRAVDSKGGSSRWEVIGPHGMAKTPWTVWGTDGSHKIWPETQPVNPDGGRVSIKCARNEWEPFQIVVNAQGMLSNVKIEAGEFQDGRGGKIAAPVVYRQHYMPVHETANLEHGHVGLVPDALVPFIHPVTGEPTGGKYGGTSFTIPAGKLEAFWFDLHVGKNVPAGIYRATIKVTADGLATVEVPVELEVFNFKLPPLKQLRGFFQLSDDAIAGAHQIRDKTKEVKRNLAHLYLEMLHEHSMDSWSPITGWNYTLNRVSVKAKDGKLIVDWTEYDKLVGPYMDGSAFRDKIPARCLFVPYYVPIKGGGELNKKNYQNIDEDLFAQWIAEVQRHMEEKGWLEFAYVFYFDEPFLQDWKYDAFIRTAKVIREKAPKLRILITDGYMGEEAYKKLTHIKEPITSYVDVWDPVTFQVRTLE